MAASEELINQTNKNRVKWGFIWAVICALLWGLGYLPMAVVWGVEPFLSFPWFTGSEGYLISGVIISGTQAIIFAAVLLFFWAGFNGKLKESVKTIVHFKISKWLLLGALFGGPLGVYGATIAIGYIDANFAAAMGLLSAVTGTVLGRIIYKERISKKTVAGMALLILGGVFVLNPAQMIENMQNSTDGVIYGYLGCIMVIIGMGIEGIFASKALEVTDSDSSSPVRYFWEAVLWVVIVFPLVAVISDAGLFLDALVASWTSGPFLFWTFLAAMTLGLCYAALYRGYSLLGVGRTLSMTAFYVPVEIVAMLALMGVIPSYFLDIGVILSEAGMFEMYWESDSIKDKMRDNSSVNQGNGGI